MNQSAASIHLDAVRRHRSALFLPCPNRAAAGLEIESWSRVLKHPDSSKTFLIHFGLLEILQVTVCMHVGEMKEKKGIKKRSITDFLM